MDANTARIAELTALKTVLTKKIADLEADKLKPADKEQSLFRANKQLNQVNTLIQSISGVPSTSAPAPQPAATK